MRLFGTRAGQPRPVQPDLLRSDREGHQQRAQHVRRPRPEHASSPTTTARTSSGPATRPRSASTTTTTRPDFQFDNNDFLVRPDPAGVFQPHEIDVVLPRLGRRRAHQPLQHHPRVLLGARPRRAEPARRRSAGHQRPDGGGRAVVRPRLGPLPHVVLLRLRRRRHQRRRGRRLRHASSTTPTSPAASSATGSGSRSACSASTSSTATSLVPDLRSSKIQGQTQLREPRPAPRQRRRRRRADAASCRLITNANFLWFDETEVLEQFVFQDDIAQLHRHRPEPGRRVPPAAEQQHHHRRRRLRR